MWLSCWLNGFGAGRARGRRERVRPRGQRGRPARELSVERLEDRLAPASGSLPPAGALDLTFGAGGTVITDFGSSSDEGHALALQSDREIVVVGSAKSGGGVGNNFAVARYNLVGSLDTSFGPNGNGK